MKICVDARMMHASGIGTYLQNLLPPLSQNFQLTLIGNAREINIANCTIINTDIPIYSISELLHFSHLVPPCDIFWSPHYNVPILPIKAKKRLVTIHDMFHLAFYRTLKLKQKLYAQSMLKAATKLSDQIITVSNFSKSEIIKYTHISADKIQVIYNGVNHQLFRIIRDNTLRQAIKQRYQLPDNFILFVGNVKPHKNLINLVRAFDKIKEDFPNTSLVIVGKKEGFITGDPDLFQLINQNVGLAHKIIFTDFVATEDLPVIYNLADLFIFPSMYEGFGLPPLEAMACGCPVLVSDRASMPEICGKETSYINPDDREDIEKKIVKMLSIPEAQRQNLIQAGLYRASLFTWDASIKGHISSLRL